MTRTLQWTALVAFGFFLLVMVWEFWAYISQPSWGV